MTKKIWTIGKMIDAASETNDGLCCVQLERGPLQSGLTVQMTPNDFSREELRFVFSHTSPRGNVTAITPAEAVNLLTKQRALTPKLTKKEKRKAKKILSKELAAKPAVAPVN